MKELTGENWRKCWKGKEKTVVSEFKKYYNTTMNKTAWNWPRNRQTDKWKYNRNEPKYVYLNLIYNERLAIWKKES